MDNNQVTSKINSNKIAILSLTLGIIGLGLSAMGIYIYLYSRMSPLESFLALIIYFIGILFAIAGLLFGIRVIKSNKNKLATVGIILCIIVFLPILYFLSLIVLIH